jgi:hypothetical protein
MATKKTATRKTSDKGAQLKEVRALAKKARDEIAKLLAEEQAGTMTRRELKTGLEEVQERLNRIMIFQDKL